MKKTTDRKLRGKGDVQVPFFLHPVVACMDLVCKVLEKEGLPRVVESRNKMAVQLCFDFACSIQDRISENQREVGLAFGQDERLFWDGRVPAVSDAYRRLDTTRCAKQDLEARVDQCCSLVRKAIPDSDIRHDPEFLALWQYAQKSSEPLPETNLRGRLEERLMTLRSEATIAYCIAEDHLREAKRRVSARDETALLRQKDVWVRMHYDNMFDLRKSRMMEISDVSRRLALQDDCDWIGRFWTKAESFAKNPREFPAETLALRDWSNAQNVLNKELIEARQKGRKANRDEAMQRWILRNGHLHGIRVSGFVRNAAYRSCVRQDQRVDRWLKKMGAGGLVEYLGSDKTAQYMALEAHVRSSMIKEDNEFSVMAKRLDVSDRRIIWMDDDPFPIPNGPEGDRLRAKIVDLSDAVGRVFHARPLASAMPPVASGRRWRSAMSGAFRRKHGRRSW